MIFTIEIPALDIPKFRELGNYPEDVYLVTKDGYENLTSAISREPWIVK
jgi:Xaa-Pro aminopeptidase